jgi:hypothetical protein
LVVVFVIVRAKGAVTVELVGLFEPFIELDSAEDGGLRKNEAKRLGFGLEVIGGIVVTAVLGFVFGELDEQAGFLFGFGDGGFSPGLQSFKLGHVLFDGASDALLVGGEELEVAGLCSPGAALGQGSVDLGVGGAGVGVLLKAEGEDGVFESAGAVEAPLVLGYRLREIEFEDAEGF